MVLFLVFVSLMLATLPIAWRRVVARSKEEWVVDLSGLAVQGIAIPLLQTVLLTALLRLLLPSWRGAIHVDFLAGFLLCFVGVDYLYYCNHRLLHGALWRWHAVHHSARAMDVLVTSRNTLWTPLLIVYVWVNAVMLTLLDNPAGYVAAITATAALDLWRHSPLRFPPRLGAIVALVLVTPHEHAWHHSAHDVDVNFGANLSIWDRIHGTFRSPRDLPDALGIALPGSVMAQFLVPSALSPRQWGEGGRRPGEGRV